MRTCPQLSLGGWTSQVIGSCPVHWWRCSAFPAISYDGSWNILEGHRMLVVLVFPLLAIRLLLHEKLDGFELSLIVCSLRLDSSVLPW